MTVHENDDFVNQKTRFLETGHLFVLDGRDRPLHLDNHWQDHRAAFGFFEEEFSDFIANLITDVF